MLTDSITSCTCYEGIDGVAVCVERHERAVRLQRARADDAEGHGAPRRLGASGAAQPVRLLPGPQVFSPKLNSHSLFKLNRVIVRSCSTWPRRTV